MHRVELSLAADAQMLFLARMTGAAVAARADFDYEQVEDLRLAIDELCVRLMGSGVGPGRITLSFQWDDEGAHGCRGHPGTGRRSSTGNGHAARRRRRRLPPMSSRERILDALVDDHGEDTIGGVHRAWLRVRRQDHSG